MSKKELDVKYEVGKKAEELMVVLQNSELSFGQGLDALALAIVVSALNAEIPKETFLETMGIRYDHLANYAKENDTFYKEDTTNNIH
jgi:hypothetical protein